jgi:penicillin-binding protein-related factor A (putative recombinase)
MTTRTPKRVKSEAEKASDRLRRQQVKKRGERWEDMLAEGFKALAAPHSIIKFEAPTKVVGPPNARVVVHTNSGPCDFEGGYRGIVTAVEAKDTAADFFEMFQLKDHQRERLELTARQGGIALVAVRMGDESACRAWAVPWSTLSAMIAVGKGSFTEDELGAGEFDAYKISCGAVCGKMAALLDPVMEEALFSLRRAGQ